MEDLQLIKQFCDLKTEFKQVEEKSALCGVMKPNQYLIVRLDGIGLSKKYLKDKVVHKRFQKTMKDAIEQTYFALHRKSRSDAQQAFLGVMVASDEVSFIFNTYDNYFEHRLFKAVSTVASTFTSFFAKKGGHKEENLRIFGAFDGRPILLSNVDEVNKYIAYRSAIYIRNSMAKLLRIKGVDSDEIYSDENHNNFDYYQRKFHQLNLDTESIMKGCIVYVPSRGEDKELKKFKNKSFTKLIALYSKSTLGLDEWLHQHNTKTAN